jgi:hypothetical protein
MKGRYQIRNEESMASVREQIFGNHENRNVTYMRNKRTPNLQEQEKESRPGILSQRSGTIMKMFILTVMMMNIHLFTFGQEKPVVSINSKQSVYGLDIKSVSAIRSPGNNTIQGVAIKATRKTDKYLTGFEWMVIYYDRKGKPMGDTLVIDNLPLPKYKPDFYTIINPDEPTDTTFFYDKETELKMEKDRERSYRQRIYESKLIFWPKGAVTAKVGIVIAEYGFVRYHASGM